MSDSPIFVLGRQHSGNTMLVMMLGRLPGVYSHLGESHFFEHLVQLENRSAAGLTRLAELIATAAQPKLEPNDVLQIVKSESSFIEMEDRNALPLLFHRTMSALAKRAGKRRWVQKATSHIFYARDIEFRLPGSKQIFIVRNPFDLAASLKRRRQGNQQLRAVWAWNRGVRLALQLHQELPGRFLMIRYEDIVSEPGRAVRQICTFIGEPFDISMIEVPHINRSEAPYVLSSDTCGPQSDRVEYFRTVLSQGERSVVRRHIDQALADYLYPELNDSERKATFLESLPAVSASLLNIANYQARILMASPRLALGRTLKRLK